MDYHFQRVNRIPARSWRWLKVNDTSLMGAAADAGAAVFSLKDLPVGFAAELDSARIGWPEVSAEPELRSFVRERRESGIKVSLAAGGSGEPLVIRGRDLVVSGSLVQDVFIMAEQGSAGSVIFLLDAEEGASSAMCALDIYVSVEKDADLQVVCVQNLKDTQDSLFSIRASVAERGRCRVRMNEMGGQKAVSACEIRLEDEAAEAELHTLYLGDGTRSLDMNYRIHFEAPKTVGNMTVKGLLQDECRKVLRDTLDFHRGAKGASGREEEDVIVLDKRARNISVPLLLCGEDDVSGEHASSTGKLDEGRLFYLMCRGLSMEEARKVLVEGAFAELISEIPSEEIRNMVSAEIGRRLV